MRGPAPNALNGPVDWAPLNAWEELSSSPDASTASVYRSLLQRCPVVHVPAEGIPGAAKHDFWGLLSFEAVAKAAADFATFSSVTTDEGPWILPLQSDPPEHAKYRRALDRYFQPAAVARLEAALRPFGEEMVAAMVASRRADYVAEFASPFPVRALYRFLGLDEEEWVNHHEWVMRIGLATGDGIADETSMIPEPLAEQMMPYLREVVKARRTKPGEDIVTGMADLEIEGRPLDEDGVSFLLVTFLLGGHVLTSSAIGSFGLRLAVDRELQDRLRAEPERIPDAIEECLRIDTPFQAMPRRCTQDTEVAGQRIECGERVLLNFGSANVNPDHWEEPEQLRPRPADKRHLAFGRGPHAGIAAEMARDAGRLAGRVAARRDQLLRARRRGPADGLAAPRGRRVAARLPGRLSDPGSHNDPRPGSGANAIGPRLTLRPSFLPGLGESLELFEQKVSTA